MYTAITTPLIPESTTQQTSRKSNKPENSGNPETSVILISVLVSLVLISVAIIVTVILILKRYSILNHRSGSSSTRISLKEPCPHSSVGSVQEVAGSISRLSRYSFRGLMIVVAAGLIPFSLLSIVSTMVIFEKQPLAWEGYCTE